MGLGNLVIYFGLFLFSVQAQAWGHFSDFENNSTHYLSYNFVHNFRINYCLILDEPTYNEEKLKLQIESALKIWLRGFSKISGKSEPTVNAVSCDDKPSIIYHVASKADKFNLQAYHHIRDFKGRKIPYIFFNRDLPQKIDNRVFLTEDLSRFVPNSMNFKDWLEDISINRPRTVLQVSRELNQSFMRMYFTSYSTLIHETGHAFGLCDTYESAKYLCDKKWISSSHPHSVMLKSDQYYLSQDDLEGLRNILERYN